jgi:Zn-dependent protease with chaperone function
LRLLVPHPPQWKRPRPGLEMEVNLLAAREINAFCMPGGKIAFTGILDQLELTDDEAAMIMRHVAHAAA